MQGAMTSSQNSECDVEIEEKSKLAADCKSGDARGRRSQSNPDVCVCVFACFVGCYLLMRRRKDGKE